MFYLTMAIGNRLSKLWSDLPQCLLELILERLILSDRLRFGSVCRSWRTAQVQCLYPPASQIPFLVFRRNSSTKGSIEFFSLSEKRIYKAPMPDCGTPLDCVLCVSSSHGWLLFRTFDRVKSGFLFNPFNRKYIQLPDDLSFMSFFTDFCIPMTFPSANFGIDFSGIFFSTPTNPDGVLYIRGPHRFMLCALKDLPQHSKWIRHLANMKDAVSNTIFCGGKLYALKDDCTLGVIDPLSPHNITNYVKMRNQVYNKLTSLRYDLMDCKYILVESCGEILLVNIEGENLQFLSKRSLAFGVYRADLTQMQWVRVQNLDDRILFLTCRTSISICASGTGCKGNRIYYIPTHKNVQRYVELDLGTKKITLHSIPVPDVDRICEWFTPCLFS